MAIYTERDAIREELANIREEKNDVRNLYRDMTQQLHAREIELLSRLRDLDVRDITSSNSPGVYDVQGLLSDLSETIVHLKELVPTVPIQVMLDEVRKQVKEESPVILEEEEPVGITSNPKFQEEVRESVARENKNKGVNAVKRDKEKSNKMQFSGKRGAPIVREYLEKVGVPVPLKTLTNILESAGFKPAANPTDRMKSVMSVEPKIQTITRGYYQLVD